jgi:hypothetical protein
VSKKKSSTKRAEKTPIFNEAMIFSVPAHALQVMALNNSTRFLRLFNIYLVYFIGNVCF